MILRTTLGLSLFLFAGYLTYELTLGHTPPMQVQDTKILTPTVPRGGVLEVQRTIERKRECHQADQRAIIDGASITWWLNDTRAFYTEAGKETFVTRYTVPLPATAGEAKLRVFLIFSCNLIQQWLPVVVELPDVPFTITKTPSVTISPVPSPSSAPATSPQ